MTTSDCLFISDSLSTSESTFTSITSDDASNSDSVSLVSIRDEDIQRDALEEILEEQ